MVMERTRQPRRLRDYNSLTIVVYHSNDSIPAIVGEEEQSYVLEIIIKKNKKLI